MSKIKGKNTKPEITLRKALWAIGIRYKIDYSKLPGKPDIVSIKNKIAIFIDGEFWHGYNWEEKKKRIKTNRDFWIPKIERNMQSDEENNVKLQKLGYHVFRFWEHDIKKNLEECLKQIIDRIADGN